MFKLSPDIDKNKMFLVNLSEIEGRLDPIYYIPYISNLEKKVRKHNPKPLRYYVKYIAGGATPKTSEKEKYYSDKENGIPFLRVQNLSPSSYLQLDDMKYINKETHNGYLKRSKVSGGDLLVKITGVGRMAVASVAPDGFVGNTNQHMVVIKTESKEISHILASYLNTDIGEKLASRRATGGTRPALDYSALLSIPIIFDKRILEITEKAVNKKQQKEAEAERLLNSIDDYLLGELGITLPEKDNSLENRMFKVNFSGVTGKRWDAFYFQTYYKENIQNINSGKYQVTLLKNIIQGNLIKGRLPSNDAKNGENKVIQIGSIDKNGNIDFTNLLTAKDIFTKEQKLKKDDIIIVITGATIGKISFWDYEGEYYLGGDLVKFQTKENINPFYIFSILRTKPYQIEIERNVTGATNGHLSPTDIEHFPIPIPPIEKQNEIAEHIKAIREQAKQLQAEAKEVLEQAKKEVEKMILGE